MIYHIAGKEILKGIISTGIYSPKGLKNEGFIHCSTKEQVVKVANRFYAIQKDLILLEIEENNLQSNIVYENLEGGRELFPHIYGPIPLDAINGMAVLMQGENGYSFPLKWHSIDDVLTW